MNLDKIFHLKENHTDVKTEVMAGITTFMTMAYILAVNPNILSASGMDRGAVFTATALSAFIATCLMALLSNYPFVLAPGMGLNAYFTYTVVLGMGYTWQQALAAVFAEGIIFILLSLTNVREAIFNSIPMNLKHAVLVSLSHLLDCRMQKLLSEMILHLSASFPSNLPLQKEHFLLRESQYCLH